MLERPYEIPKTDLFYQLEADNDFHLFLKREPYLLEIPHCHGSIEFAYVECSETVAHIQNQKQRLTAGDICFVNRFQIHSFEYYKKELSAISVVLSKEYTSAFMKVCSGNTLPPFMLDKEKNQPAIDVLNEWVEHGAKSFLLNCSYANRFFDALLKAYELQPTKVSAFNQKAIDFINYINKNFDKPISLKTMASEFGYSEGRCSYLFNTYVGISFKKYLNNVRMQKALAMIDSNNYTIAQIIEQSGFTSPVTFYRQYAKYKEKMSEHHTE